ncbi:MAG: hypothetical protein ABEK36_02915 [Candidatus Aenigmatarchaeota archaeon]
MKSKIIFALFTCALLILISPNVMSYDGSNTCRRGEKCSNSIPDGYVMNDEGELVPKMEYDSEVDDPFVYLQDKTTLAVHDYEIVD